MSTAHPYSTTSATAIVADPECGDHALYLDGSLVGFARTAHEAQTILDQLVHERHPDSSSAIPLRRSTPLPRHSVSWPPTTTNQLSMLKLPGSSHTASRSPPLAPTA